MTRQRRSSAFRRDMSRPINATEQRSRTRNQPAAPLSLLMLIPVSSRSSRLIRQNLDAIQANNASAAGIARHHVQVSLVVCSRAADDSEFFCSTQQSRIS
jgi:hypothetical protein